MPGVARAVTRIATAVPDSIAIRTDERDVTYGELVVLAGGLTGHLRGGVRSEPVLALAADAVDMAVATLAAAGVGRPVVIVSADTSPAAALTLMARSGATEVIGPPGLEQLGEQRITAIGERQEAFDPVERAGEETVMLIGTSGSTGDPRLVGIQERRFGADAVESAVLSGLTARSRIATTFSTASAPASVIVRTLMAGATCTVIDVRRVPASKLLRLLDDHGVTRIRIVPSVLRSIMTTHATPSVLEQVEVLGALGERLHWQDVVRARALLPRTAVVTNAYGTSETGLIAERFIASDEDPRDGFVDIGLPVAGRSVWIDDGSGRAAAHEVIGEIVVDGRFGTAGIRAEMLPNGLERYRTGDLGSVLPDGSLVHHGRRDRESKVGGYRVDLVAVEAALRSIPGVLDVAVLDGDGSGSGSDTSSQSPTARTVLTAHVQAEQHISVDIIRAALSERLLAPAVPSGIRLHRGPLPRLPSGKLDVGALRVQFA
jgi:acyl-coenzyme A synthetase/AMP-(fatty) acid ligase